MRKRQKIILILNVVAVFFVSFVYVPFNVYTPNGVKYYAGHHLRPGLIQSVWGMEFWEEKVSRPFEIDATLMIAEMLAVTIIFIIISIVLQRKEQHITPLKGPF